MRAATTPAQESEPSTTQAVPAPQRVGDPRALLAARLLAAAALQVWFMTKIVAAFAQASVPALWLLRQIAPSSPPQ